MKSHLLAVTLLSAAVMSQPGVSQAQDASSKKRGCEATLSANKDVVLADGEVKLTLKVHAREDTEIDATVLAGHDLEVKINGKDGPKIVDKVPGKVKLAAGTRVERTLTIPCKRVFPEGAPKDVARVTFAWPTFLGAGATLTVAPDMSSVKLDELDLSKTTVTLVTSHGNMTLSFRPDKAPNHVKNFVKLAKEGFYDSTRFHRVIKGFMIQGGCPNTKEGAVGTPGTGNPGYTIDAEFNDLRHVRGVLSMARSSDPDSAGCQFFIMHGTNRGLDGKYTAFGQLESGFETLDKIANVRCGGRAGSTPVKPVHLKVAIVNPVFKKNQ